MDSRYIYHQEDGSVLIMRLPYIDEGAYLIIKGGKYCHYEINGGGDDELIGEFDTYAEFEKSESECC